MSSSDSSQDEEKPAEEAEEDDSFLRERLEELCPGTGLDPGLGLQPRPWSEPGPSQFRCWLSRPWSVTMTAGMEGAMQEEGFVVGSESGGEGKFSTLRGASTSGLTSDPPASACSGISRPDRSSRSPLASLSVRSLSSPDIAPFSTSPASSFSPPLFSPSVGASRFFLLFSSILDDTESSSLSRVGHGAFEGRVSMRRGLAGRSAGGARAALELSLPVYLQQLRLASPFLPPLSFGRVPCPLLLALSFPSLLTAGRAQPSDPLAHVDSQELGAPRGRRARVGGGAGGERGRRRGEDEGSTQGSRTLGAHKQDGRGGASRDDH
ncbi:hypothetical protein EYF80_036844 [Liparis tanakae]|uniref:Uncharacterized protein n=1 Tax=Liparis tanakae TaxID=230148 RepID=A0A4Z2GHY3_9TELE|nr:hypothetical protein EYF80_036844 [Liparis tanakae]